MKISMKGDYGIRALVDLAGHYGEGPMQSKDIAERQDIPEPYLDQLLMALRRAGFIHSRRGRRGGHALARDPSSIHLGEVMTTLEGPTAVIGCLDGTITCKHSGRCGQQEVWQTISDMTQKILDATSIDSLLERQKVLQQRAMYYI